MHAIATPFAQIIFAFSLAALTACDQIDVFVTAATNEGTVYECELSNGNTVELCYFDDSATELGDLLGATCGEPSRRWPWFVNHLELGCAYSCEGHIGCNAHHGCYCP